MNSELCLLLNEWSPVEFEVESEVTTDHSVKVMVRETATQLDMSQGRVTKLVKDRRLR